MAAERRAPALHGRPPPSALFGWERRGPRRWQAEDLSHLARARIFVVRGRDAPVTLSAVESGQVLAGARALSITGALAAMAQAVRPERTRTSTKPPATDGAALRGQWMSEVHSDLYTLALLTKRPGHISVRTHARTRADRGGATHDNRCCSACLLLPTDRGVDTLTATIQHLIAQHTAVLHSALHNQDHLQQLLRHEREGRTAEAQFARLLRLQLAITERQLSEARRPAHHDGSGGAGAGGGEGGSGAEKRKFEGEE